MASATRRKLGPLTLRATVIMGLLTVVAALMMAGLAGCAPEGDTAPSTSVRPDAATTATAVMGIHGLDAVPSGCALLVQGESKEGMVVHRVRSLIIPELGIFRIELDPGDAPAEMLLTVRTPEQQSGYRLQVVLEGGPRPMDMALLESPLTYPSGQWIVKESTRTGDHVSATLARKTEPAVEERTIEADVDPQTGIILSEEQTRQYVTSTITRRLVPLASQTIPDPEEVLVFARTDWQKSIAAAGSLGYPVLGLDLPALQLHMLQFAGGEVWLDYSSKNQPGRSAVRTWQLPDTEAEAVPTRFPTSWAASSSDAGEPGRVRAFFFGHRAVQVFVYDSAVSEDPAMLDDIEGALLPLAETDQARTVEPAVLLFDGPMPIPSGANFGGLLPEAYRKDSG